MNPITAGASVNNRNAFRQQYLNSLRLEISNQTKNLNANKLFKANGSTGSEPADTRSVTERYEDIDGLKREVRVGLKELTDGLEAENIIAEISTAELQFLAGHLPFIIGDLKPKWKLGVPAGAFLPYLRKLMRKNIETEGVDYGLQQPTLAAGGAIITENEAITLGDIDDFGDELADIVSMEGVTRAQEQRATEIGRRLRMLRNLRPTAADRAIIADSGDPLALAEYDEDVSLALRDIPSVDAFSHIYDIRPASEMLRQLSQVLDGIDWGLLQGLKNAVNMFRAQARSPYSEQGRPAERVNPEESLLPQTPLGKVSDLQETELQQSRTAGTDLPSSYVDRPSVVESFKPYEPLSYEISVPDFLDQSYDTKAELLCLYADQGKFNNMEPQLLHMINLLLEGGNPPESHLDSFYSKYVALSKLGSLNYSNQGDIRGRPKFQSESAMPEEEPLPARPIPQFQTESAMPEEEETPNFPQGLMASVPMYEYQSFSPKKKKRLISDMLTAGDFDGSEYLEYAKLLVAQPEPPEDAMDYLYAAYLHQLSGEAPPPKSNPPSPEKTSSYVPPQQTEEHIQQKLTPNTITANLTPPPFRMPPPDVFAPLSNEEKTQVFLAGMDNGLLNVTDENFETAKRFYEGLTSGKYNKISTPWLDLFYSPMYAKYKSIGGTGLRGKGRPKTKKNIIFGKGLNVIPQPKVKVSGKNIDLSKGIESEPAYVPFGTHLLNKHKLKDNIVMMRTKKGGAITNIPTQKVSNKLSSVLKTISGGGIPAFDSVADLTADDKDLLHKIAKTSKVSDKLSVPNPNKSKQEEEDNRFNILRGEISIGQDNPQAIKEFKILLLKFIREGRVPVGQGKAIMEELLLLGH
jgi:hypothetical protein